MAYETQDSIKRNDPDRAVISAALTGALTTRDQCEAIPYTPTEIAEDAAAAREAGAAIAHIHARTDTGQPTFEPETYQEIYDEVRDRTDIVINFSTGSVFDNLEKRLEYVSEVQPDIAALNMGSMNYAKYSDSREDFVFDMVFENPFEEIRRLLRTMQESGVKPELECFDTGHIGNTRPILKGGEIDPPLQFNLILGVLGGIPATVDNLAHQVRQLPGPARGHTPPPQRARWPLPAAWVAGGGTLRGGRENTFPPPRGEVADTTPDLAGRPPELVQTAARDPATPDEARRIIDI